MTQGASAPFHMEHLTGCARCHGEGHDHLDFQPLTHPFTAEDNGRPFSFTHWCPCPANGEPILFGIAEPGTAPNPIAVTRT